MHVQFPEGPETGKNRGAALGFVYVKKRLVGVGMFLRVESLSLSGKLRDDR